MEFEIGTLSVILIVGLLALISIGVPMGFASGFMGAITAISNGLRSVVILEGTQKVLEKVRISGGGRCNLTNSCFEISNLVNNYPRGEKQLLGLFNRFSTTEAFDWFQEKGLSLKVEKDGRVFPCSDSSEEVIKMKNKIYSFSLLDKDNKSMTASLKELKEDIMIISQFTLAAVTTKGTKPSFHKSAKPEEAKVLYDEFVNAFKNEQNNIVEGIFGEYMEINLTNKGPVTFNFQVN